MKKRRVDQYLRPKGRKKTVYCEMNDEVYELSEGMLLSAEVLKTREVAFYARYEDEDWDKELMVVGPNDQTVSQLLEELIREKAKEKEAK